MRIYDGTRYVEIAAIQSIGSRPLTGAAEPGNGWDHSGSHQMIERVSTGQRTPSKRHVVTNRTRTPRKRCACGRQYRGEDTRCRVCRAGNTHGVVTRRVA